MRCSSCCRLSFACLPACLPPEYGLCTAIVPCAVVALFGASWHVVSGPTNANSLALTVIMEFAILLGTVVSLLNYLHCTSCPRMRVMGFDVPGHGDEIPERPFVVRDSVASPLPECP